MQVEANSSSRMVGELLQTSRVTGKVLRRGTAEGGRRGKTRFSNLGYARTAYSQSAERQIRQQDPHNWMIPRLTAIATASVRSLAPSLSIMCLT
jgi:hypothetical protein